MMMRPHVGVRLEEDDKPLDGIRWTFVQQQMCALTRPCSSSGRELCDLAMINDLYVACFRHWGSPADRLQFSRHILSLSRTMTKAPTNVREQPITWQATSSQSGPQLMRRRCCPNADGGT